MGARSPPRLSEREVGRVGKGSGMVSSGARSRTGMHEDMSLGQALAYAASIRERSIAVFPLPRFSRRRARIIGFVSYPALLRCPRPKFVGACRGRRGAAPSRPSLAWEIHQRLIRPTRTSPVPSWRYIRRLPRLL